MNTMDADTLKEEFHKRTLDGATHASDCVKRLLNDRLNTVTKRADELDKELDKEIKGQTISLLSTTLQDRISLIHEDLLLKLLLKTTEECRVEALQNDTYKDELNEIVGWLMTKTIDRRVCD